MSWSVSGSGNLKGVKKSVKAQFKQAKTYVSGEEGKLLELARKLVVRHMKTHPKHLAIAVSASGSASGLDYDQTTGKYKTTSQQISITCSTVSNPQMVGGA